MRGEGSRTATREATLGQDRRMDPVRDLSQLLLDGAHRVADPRELGADSWSSSGTEGCAARSSTASETSCCCVPSWRLRSILRRVSSAWVTMRLRELARALWLSALEIAVAIRLVTSAKRASASTGNSTEPSEPSINAPRPPRRRMRDSARVSPNALERRQLDRGPTLGDGQVPHPAERSRRSGSGCDIPSLPSVSRWIGCWSPRPDGKRRGDPRQRAPSSCSRGDAR